MPLVAALAFTSCSSDEPLVADSGFDETYDGQAYMRVRIAMPDGANTRSTDDNFEAGSAEEQAIKSIGLKFYNSDGSFYGYGIPVDAVTVTPTTPSSSDPGDAGNSTIEGKVAEAVIVLQINSNAPKPTHVVAYANCGDGWKQTPEPNIDQIDNTMLGYTTTYDGKNYYAMTSSNFRSDSSGLATFDQGYMTPINPDSFKPSEAEAKADGVPVDIYVERLAAKVKVGTADGMNPEPVVNGDYTLEFTIDGYVLGGTNTDSYYIKHIIDQWNVTTLWNGWNEPKNHRCYWAADMNYTNGLSNPPSLDYVSYNEVRNGLTSNVGKWLYSTENTQTPIQLSGGPKDAQTAPAENELNRYLYQEFVYVIGHYTVKHNGVELTGDKAPYLYEYAGKVLPEDAMAQYMQQTLGNVLYAQSQRGDHIYYTSVDLVTEGLVEIGRYGDDASLVCLKLTDKATQNDCAELKKYYIKKATTVTGDGKDESDYAQVASASDVEPLLKQSAVQAYGFKYDNNCANTGKGGYLAYFPILIKHLNTGTGTNEDSRGYYGVVRNHCYYITINQIKGLGIGIYDPTVDIIPKDKIKPLYLAATFNILSWRVVNQQVDL